MRRTIAGLSLAALLCIAACGSGDDGAENESSTTTATTTATPTMAAPGENLSKDEGFLTELDARGLTAGFEDRSLAVDAAGIVCNAADLGIAPVPENRQYGGFTRDQELGFLRHAVMTYCPQFASLLAGG